VTYPLKFRVRRGSVSKKQIAHTGFLRPTPQKDLGGPRFEEEPDCGGTLGRGAIP